MATINFPLDIVINNSSSSSSAANPVEPLEREPAPKFNNFPISYYGSILDVIGSGSYGTIYKTSQGYALKVINHVEEAIKRDFLNEVVYSASLNHPGLIKYLAVFHSTDLKVRKYMKDLVEPDDIYSIIVMPLYEGSLFNLNIARNLEQVKSISFQIITALAYLASRNIIHCDVKPDNIFTKKEGHTINAVIGDFGLATSQECLTHVNRFTDIISLFYRPPEIAANNLKYNTINYDSKVDVWSTACTLYELYTGEVLFRPELKTAYPDQPEKKLSLNIKEFNNYDFKPVRKIASMSKNMASDITDPNKLLLQTIFDTLGPPNAADGKVYQVYKKYNFFTRTKVAKPLTDNTELNELLLAMLRYHPSQRISFSAAQTSKFFTNLNNNQLVNSIACVDKPGLFERYFHFNTLSRRFGPAGLNDLNRLLLWVLRISQEVSVITDRTFILAAELIYKFLNLRIVPQDKLGLLGMTCLYISSVFYDDNIGASYLVHISGGIFTIQELMNITRDVLDNLKYDLLATIPWDHINSQNLSVKRTSLANKLLAISVPIIALYMPDYEVDRHLGNQCLIASRYLDDYKLSTAEEVKAMAFLATIKKFYKQAKDDIAMTIMGPVYGAKIFNK